MKRESWKSFRLQRSGLRGVIFGFQHEDQRVEQEVLGRTAGARALCICSGGEVALGLLAAGADTVVAVDVNPAQLELFEIKRKTIEMGAFEDLSSDARGAELMASGDWASPEYQIPSAAFRHGICFAGQVEQRAIWFSRFLCWFARDPGKLRWRLGWRLIPVAVWLGYAAAFRRYLPVGWCTRMKERVEAVIASGGNLWWSVEKGERFGEFGNPLYWDERLKSETHRIELRNTGLGEVFAADETWDLIALSNVIDTMSEMERVDLFEGALSRLREGGRFVVRSMIFPPGSLPEISGLIWEALPVDRSPICPVVGVARRV